MTTDDDEAETVEQAQNRYFAAAHAMQSGVSYVKNHRVTETEPKHLRVGINSAMVEHSALVGLLLKAGVITEADYYTALADAMEREAESYRRRIARELGMEVTLR